MPYRTYTVKAPLLMSGDFTLEVKLLLSVEGIYRWTNFTAEPTHKHTTTYGKFGKIEGSGLPVKVSPATNFLSLIRYGMVIKDSFASGCLHAEKWVSLKQKVPIESVASSRECFRNKVVFLLGDSTIKQFFYVGTSTFTLTRSFHASKINGQTSQIDQSKHDNITDYYKTHGMPIQLTGLSATRPYLSDTIESLTLGGSNVYVIDNVGVHLAHYDVSYYIHRLMRIKKDILDHLKIYPETRFIFRGMNVVESIQEWALFRFEIILREIFKDLDRVVVLNVWDFTTMIPLND
ncbi:NXPE family member 3-like [Clavelina lepadiformis]|uniref:NXPE family member 3-like n=1 Tax=Clavelina lepadiformis TaxID=159417 RepID=UPI0040410A1B